MKIISKYKDYYDYLSGIYGVDNKIVLDRRDFDTPIILEGKISLRICGKTIEGWYVDEQNKFYYGNDIINVPGAIFRDRSKYPWGLSYSYYEIITKDRRGYNWKQFTINPEIIDDVNHINEKEKCPIILVEGSNDQRIFKYYPLKLLQLNNYISPKDLYLMLSEWLAPKDIVSDNLSDKEKILSKGFDLKHSFRNTK